MPKYQIFYLKDRWTPSFREAPPKAPPYRLKPTHYEPGEQLDAASPYALWNALRSPSEAEQRDRLFGVGDAVEQESSGLLICNYWGFDKAEWSTPEAEQAIAGAPLDPADGEQVEEVQPLFTGREP